eukprot:517950-Pleurochrysis_carterae.AAC.1
MRFTLLQNLSKLVQAEWETELALFLRSELGLSDRNFDKARLVFSCQWVVEAPCEVHLPHYRQVAAHAAATCFHVCVVSSVAR